MNYTLHNYNCLSMLTLPLEYISMAESNPHAGSTHMHCNSGSARTRHLRLNINEPLQVKLLTAALFCLSMRYQKCDIKILLGSRSAWIDCGQTV